MQREMSQVLATTRIIVANSKLAESVLESRLLRGNFSLDDG